MLVSIKYTVWGTPWLWNKIGYCDVLLLTFGFANLFECICGFASLWTSEIILPGCAKQRDTGRQMHRHKCGERGDKMNPILPLVGQWHYPPFKKIVIMIIQSTGVNPSFNSRSFDHPFQRKTFICLHRWII